LKLAQHVHHFLKVSFHIYCQMPRIWGGAYQGKCA
jgi:hypothetical protein